MSGNKSMRKKFKDRDDAMKVISRNKGRVPGLTVWSALDYLTNYCGGSLYLLRENYGLK